MKQMLNNTIGIVAILLALTSCTEDRNALPEEVVQNIQNRIDFGLNGAIAIGVIDNEGIRYYNFGTSNSSGDPVNEHTIFGIASITKTITATLLADQVAKGKVRLDDPLSVLLPDSLVMPVLGNQQITLGHLADHTSGLPHNPSNLNPANPKNPYIDYTISQLYDEISSYDPVGEIGEKYQYSNVAFGLLGHVLALNAGKSYDDLLNEVITDPLEMTETKVVLNEVMMNNLAEGRDPFGRETENKDFATLAGAWGLSSSTSDLIKYVSAHLGITNTSLRQAMNLTHEQRHTKFPVNEGENPIGLGLGWRIGTREEGTFYFHYGDADGYKSYVHFNKSLQKGVVVLTSGARASDIGDYLMYSDSLDDISKQPLSIIL